MQPLLTGRSPSRRQQRHSSPEGVIQRALRAALNGPFRASRQAGWVTQGVALGWIGVPLRGARRCCRNFPATLAGATAITASAAAFQPRRGDSTCITCGIESPFQGFETIPLGYPGQHPGHQRPLHTSPEGANQPMSQSLARLHVHLVFSTKRRVPWLQEGIRSSMHAYLASVLKDMDCPASLINSVEDHVHILFALGRTTALSVAVEQLKKTSSKWVKTQGLDFAGFGWQAGYGAFSVSESNVATVRRYIADQRAHHQAKTFEDELRALLERHGVEFDERYVWD